MPRDKRRHLRKPAPVVGLVDVYRSSRKGTRGVWAGASLLEDMSSSGLSIQMDKPLAPGEQLYLQNRYVDYIARVRRCTPTFVGFQIGLEFLRRRADWSAAGIPLSNFRK